MKDYDDSNSSISRRDFLRIAGAGVTALGLGTVDGISRVASAAPVAGQAMQDGARATGPYNILFILTDQERFFRPGELPAGFGLPARERLAKQGTTFLNHRINSCVCTPSRSVLYTGRHIQDTRMFDNTNFPWIGSMSTERKCRFSVTKNSSRFCSFSAIQPCLVSPGAPDEQGKVAVWRITLAASEQGPRPCSENGTAEFGGKTEFSFERGARKVRVCPASTPISHDRRRVEPSGQLHRRRRRRHRLDRGHEWIFDFHVSDYLPVVQSLRPKNAISR